MENKIKIMCAELLNLKIKKEVNQKYATKYLSGIVNRTATLKLPEQEELEQLQLLLIEGSKLDKDILEKIEELNDLMLQVGMNQMVMNLGGTNGN